MVQSLRAVALTEDQGLILRTHMTAHNLISAPDLTSLLISLGTGHACGGHTCIRAKHSHIHLNFFLIKHRPCDLTPQGRGQWYVIVLSQKASCS